MKDFGGGITYERDGHVAILTITGAGPLNIIDKPFYKGYNDALVEFREDDSRILLIKSGNDKHFTAGFDVSQIISGQKEGYGNTITDNDMVTPKPIVSAIKGYCIGEGVGVMLASDFVFADKSLKISCPETKLGVPAVTMQVKFAQRIGHNRTMEFMMGDLHDVEWLDKVGLCTKICDGDADEQALAYAHKIVNGTAPIAVRGTKGAVWHTVNSNKDEAIDFALWAKDLAIDSKDFEEGVAAYLEKRSPTFKDE